MSSEEEARADVDSLLGSLGITRAQKDEIGERLTSQFSESLIAGLESGTQPKLRGMRRLFSAWRRTN